ncbi:unnamed protein product [Trichobilharzia regenti]|nr:unnamed protein product [Trichobilharzia regenti]
MVIEDGFLASFLREDLPPEVTIVRLPKSSGAITRSPDQWIRQRDSRVCAYLHGENPLKRLHPHQIVLKSSEVSYIFVHILNVTLFPSLSAFPVQYLRTNNILHNS